MTDYPHHERLRLENFTVFEDATFEFVPGVNILTGENGTGKTHALKALYSWQRLAYLGVDFEEGAILVPLLDTFQTLELDNLARLGGSKDFLVAGKFGSHTEFHWGQLSSAFSGKHVDWVAQSGPRRPVFIPAIDMMGHSKGFVVQWEDIKLDFDLTYRDIVALLQLERKVDKSAYEAFVSRLERDVLKGTITSDDNGRFYLQRGEHRIPMPMMAEGLRKVATLIKLVQNGHLEPGATLFWDEPETNMNPALMDEIAQAILALAGNGVQVFIATHSYLLLKELEVWNRSNVPLRFFALEATEDRGVVVHPADTYLDLSPNPIERQYAELYDREIQREIERSQA